MVHLYIGRGKGKTSAACGLALRAAGAGKRVYIAQFLKGQHLPSGLVKAFSGSGLSVDIERFRDQVHPLFTENREAVSDRQVISSTSEALRKIAVYLKKRKYDLIVCDELLNSLEAGFCTLAQIKELVDSSGDCELVFTGLSSPQELIGIADYVSRIDKIKHPFDKGAEPRKGIEY